METRQRTWPVRNWWKLTLGIVLVLAIVLGAVAWFGSERALNPTLRADEWTTADYPDLLFEEITFESDTGVTLNGRFFPGDGDATVVTLHGFTTRQNQVLPQVAMLNRAGFNVLSYDSRHPEYGAGIYATLGVLERNDLVSAIDYLIHERDDIEPERIGAWGVSLGGATVLLAAELDPRIRAVIAEAAFSDGKNVVASSFEHFIGLPSFPFANVTQFTAERRANARLADAQPIDAIQSLTDRPVLLIHGLADDAVPADHTERNLAVAPEHVDVWFVPDAGHNNVWEIGGEEYETRLVTFFTDALLD